MGPLDGSRQNLLYFKRFFAARKLPLNLIIVLVNNL